MDIYRMLQGWIRLAPGQWETSLQSNAVSHWLGPNLESAQYYIARLTEISESYWHYFSYGFSKWSRNSRMSSILFRTLSFFFPFSSNCPFLFHRISRLNINNSSSLFSNTFFFFAQRWMMSLLKMYNGRWTVIFYPSSSSFGGYMFWFFCWIVGLFFPATDGKWISCHLDKLSSVSLKNWKDKHPSFFVVLNVILVLYVKWYEAFGGVFCPMVQPGFPCHLTA